ncbi:MAG: ABC transporter substrate-binding protein, partial [Comamonadaceae bacterium]
PANAVQIANRMVGQRANVIVAIATPSAQAALGATRDIPIVFSAVTDPVAAKLVANATRPGGNVTGVSDAVSLDEHVAFARTVVPALKRLGVVYNPGEANSVALIAKLRTAVKAAGLELVESPANRTADLTAATERLGGKVDALYVPTDNVVASGVEAVVAAARALKIPTIGGDNSFVPRGVMAAGGGFDYHELGRITGRMVADILRGKKPGDIPVGTSTNFEIVVNQDEARRIGFTIPDAVVARAKK